MPSFDLVSFEIFLTFLSEFVFFGGHSITDIDTENVYSYVEFLYKEINRFPLKWTFSSNEELIKFVFTKLDEAYFEFNVIDAWSYVLLPMTPKLNTSEWDYLNGYYESKCFNINPFDFEHRLQGFIHNYNYENESRSGESEKINLSDNHSIKSVGKLRDREKLALKKVKATQQKENYLRLKNLGESEKKVKPNTRSQQKQTMMRDIMRD
jgi:hypothetical protein